MGKVIGIDLGTTNSVMAHMERNQPQTIENLDSMRWTPSVVGISSDGERVVGESARSQAFLYPEETIFSIKRFMGMGYRDEKVQKEIALMPYKVTEAETGEVAVWLGGKPYTPHEISAFILEALKRDAEVKLDDEVTHAVITVPAYFDTAQKAATREAGRKAGLKVMNVLAEPTAAAMAYGISAQPSKPQTILVYDLGGGTFDITVLYLSGGIYSDLSKKGDNHLGGDDFDREIMEFLIQHTWQKHGVNLREDRAALQKLKDHAEKAKIALSGRLKVPIVIPAVAHTGGRYIDIAVDLTRERYEQMIRENIRKTIHLTHEAIKEADCRPEDVNHILLVGGSTYTPLVIDSLRREFGEEKIKRQVNPMECVALGAAIQTAIPMKLDCTHCRTENDPWQERCTNCHSPLYGAVEQPEIKCINCGKATPRNREKCVNCGKNPYIDFIHTDIVSKPLGIQTTGGKMSVIIDKNTNYPTPKPVPRIFHTEWPNQTLLRLPVYEGEHENVAGNTFLGEVRGQLPPGLPEGTDVSVSFYIDRDGILLVIATLPSMPEVKVMAELDYVNRRPTPAPEPTGGTPPPPQTWQQESQGLLNWGAFMLERYGQYIQPGTIYMLQGLMAELQQAILSTNEALSRQKNQELQRALDALGDLNWLAYGEALATNPDISLEHTRKLKNLLAEVQQAMQQGNHQLYETAILKLVQAIQDIGLLTPDDQRRMEGLLRSSRFR